MGKDARVWIDVGLLFFFPATVATGLFHGPGRFPCYWHTGTSLILVLLVIAHMVNNEHGLTVVLKRFREKLVGGDDGVTFEKIFEDPENYE